MYDLEQTLKDVSQVVDGSDSSITMDAFIENYTKARELFHGQSDWVRFHSFDEFKNAITVLVYISLIYVYSKNGSVEGVAENTGFVTDFTNAYSWWNCIERKKPIMFDGKPWDYDMSLIEVRQTLAAGQDWYEIKLIVPELVNMDYDKLVDINSK